MKKVITLVFILFCCHLSNAQVTDEKETLIEEDEVVKEEAAPEDIPYAIIENVPIFPGCSGTQQQKKQCLNMAIQKHVVKNFKVKRVKRLKLSPGKKKIYIKFRIDKNGDINQVLARGPHEKAEKEGIRVVKLLPKMIPGKQRGQDVNVTYMLPITFNIE